MVLGPLTLHLIVMFRSLKAPRNPEVLIACKVALLPKIGIASLVLAILAAVMVSVF